LRCPARARRAIGLFLLSAYGLFAASAAYAADGRTFEFEYVVRVHPIGGGEREAGDENGEEVHVFVPLPTNDARQQVLDEEILASVPGRIEIEPVHGNRFYHLSYPTDGRALDVTIRTTVEREVVRAGERSEPDPAVLFRHLAGSTRVVVDHPVLQPMLADVRRLAGSGATAAKARAIYDWVVDHMEYKKVGNGWGNGDTFWACSERYGNCTDFHALVMSLARTEGIPARFEIGFSIPEDRSEGDIDGYHCWVELHLEETGWLPIDAAEASKQPERRDLFYGTHPADRIHFTTGRDLKLGPDHRGPALNFFIYPHVEVDGHPHDGPIETRFRYRNLPRLPADSIASKPR